MIRRTPRPELKRKTTSGRYIPAFDGIRFVALLMVLLYHAHVVLQVVTERAAVVEPFGKVWRPAGFPPMSSDWFTRLLLQGHLGLELFFVVSGFMLALPFVSARLAGGPPVGLRRYARRRLTRLEPPYVLAVGLSLLVAAGAASRGDLWTHAWTSLLYVHGPLMGGLNPVNGPVWSLEAEVQFYVLVPALAGMFALRNPVVRRGLLAAAVVASGLLQPAVVPGAGWLAISMANYLQFFLMGLLLADVYVVDWRSRPRQHPGWDAVSIAGWPAILAVAVLGSGHVDRVVLPWLAALVIVAALRGPRTNRALSNRWVTAVGGMCYSIYLLHYPIQLLLAGTVRPVLTWVHVLDLALVVSATMPAVLLAGVAYFRLVERPCMEPDWPERLRARIGARTRRPRAIAVGHPMGPVHSATPGSWPLPLVAGRSATGAGLLA